MNGSSAGTAPALEPAAAPVVHPANGPEAEIAIAPPASLLSPAVLDYLNALVARSDRHGHEGTLVGIAAASALLLREISERLQAAGHHLRTIAAPSEGGKGLTTMVSFEPTSINQAMTTFANVSIPKTDAFQAIEKQLGDQKKALDQQSTTLNQTKETLVSQQASQADDAGRIAELQTALQLLREDMHRRLSQAEAHTRQLEADHRETRERLNNDVAMLLQRMEIIEEFPSNAAHVAATKRAKPRHEPKE